MGALAVDSTIALGQIPNRRRSQVLFADLGLFVAESRQWDLIGYFFHGLVSAEVVDVETQHTKQCKVEEDVPTRNQAPEGIHKGESAPQLAETDKPVFVINEQGRDTVYPEHCLGDGGPSAKSPCYPVCHGDVEENLETVESMHTKGETDTETKIEVESGHVEVSRSHP